MADNKSRINAVWREPGLLKKRRFSEQFSDAQGDSRTSKIRAIMHNFPGRTKKAIATKLRANFPIIYYGRAQEEPQARAPIPDPDPPQEERGQNDEDEKDEGVTHTNTQN